MKKSAKFAAKDLHIGYDLAKEILSNYEPDGRSKSEYSVPTYSDETIEQAAYDYNIVEYYDWYCDECGENLNLQGCFGTTNRHWKCTNCGHVNFIDASEVRR